MRVAIDAINLLADERGMGRYVRRIITGLAARADFEITLLVRDPERTAAYREALGTDVTLARLESARKRARYDAVWYPWNALRFPARAPSLVTVNDDFAFRYPARGFVARRREQRPIRRAIARATRLATISQWSRAQLAERFRLDPETIAVLPLAPDPFFTPAREASPRALPFVLAVGGTEKRKNVPFLRKVFRRAFPGGGVELVVVGGRGVAPIGDPMLRRLYRTAAVVAVPSLAEGFGLVAAEAQACGAPVIAAHTSALPEAVGDAAVAIDPEFHDAWVDALRAVAGDPELQIRLGERAAARWAFTPRDAATAAVADLLHALR